MASTFRNIWSVASKELRGYFTSPVAWVMMGLFAFIFGFFFITYLNLFVRNSMQSAFGQGPQSMNINMELVRPLLGLVSTLVLFLLPMVTMRTYSEEKQSGTIELLLTSPITDFEIIVGKFLGTVGLYAALLGVTTLYISILFIYGQPEWKPILSGYFGLLLLGSCFISLGLAISSTTKNQMVAGAATFVVLLLFWIVSWLADSSGPMLSQLLSYLSITEHFDDFGKGIIDTKHVVYYLSLMAFGLFLTLKSVDSERWRG